MPEVPIHVVPHADVPAWGHRFARALDDAGVPQRGVVAVLLTNTPEFPFVDRGVAWSGRRLVPMSWRWTPEEAAYVLENCGADVLVADARFAEAAVQAAETARPALRFAVGGDLPGFRPFEEVAACSPDELAEPIAGDVMMYTSGTTGRPKGVKRPERPPGPPPNEVGGPGAAMLQAFVPDAGDGAHLVTAPLYHAGPMTYSQGAVLLGADLVLMERFDPEEALRLIEAHRVRSTFMVPTHFVRLLQLPEETRRRYDLSSLQLVAHGAAPVAPDVKRRMIEWLGPILFEFYGGSEGGGCMISSEEWLRKPGSVGRARPGVDVCILDEDGNRVPAGTEGGVYFNLEATPFEYKDDTEKTEASRRGGLFTIGDVGYLDEDSYLFLCDRSADVIVSGGVNLYPAQIEAVLLELPFVVDCCVVGTPDDEWGERVTAVLQVAEDATPANLEDAVLDHCRKRLSGHQVPRAVVLHPDLPRTETGKLARRTIRAPYWEGRKRRI